MGYHRLPTLEQMAKSNTLAIFDTNFISSEYFINEMYKDIEKYNDEHPNEPFNACIPLSCFLELEGMVRCTDRKHYTEDSAKRANLILDIIIKSYKSKSGCKIQLLDSELGFFADPDILAIAQKASIKRNVIIFTNEWGIAYDTCFHSNSLTSVTHKPIKVARYDERLNILGIPDDSLIAQKLINRQKRMNIKANPERRLQAYESV